MTILYKDFRIKSQEAGGYIVQRKIGNQFKEASYFNSLSQAANYLFEQRLHHESVDIVIDASDKARATIAQAKLVWLIKDISDQIASGLDA